MTGEDDGPAFRVELRPQAQARLIGLPAEHLRVDRLHEGVHAVEAFWRRARRQPFEIAVGTRDIAVRAGRDVDDDLATPRHESDLRSQDARGVGDGQPALPFAAGSRPGARSPDGVLSLPI